MIKKVVVLQYNDLGTPAKRLKMKYVIGNMAESRGQELLLLSPFTANDCAIFFVF